MKRLLSIALSAALLSLGLGAPAGAQVATEYGVIVSHAPHPPKNLTPKMNPRGSYQKHRVEHPRHRQQKPRARRPRPKYRHHSSYRKHSSYQNHRSSRSHKDYRTEARKY